MERVFNINRLSSSRVEILHGKFYMHYNYITILQCNSRTYKFYIQKFEKLALLGIKGPFEIFRTPLQYLTKGFRETLNWPPVMPRAFRTADKQNCSPNKIEQNSYKSFVKIFFNLHICGIKNCKQNFFPYRLLIMAPNLKIFGYSSFYLSARRIF